MRIEKNNDRILILGDLSVKIILHLKPTASLHDILPSRLFKDVVGTIGPNILLIINRSLFHGIVPLEFKHAVIEPVLKKIHLDSTDLKKFQITFYE